MTARKRFFDLQSLWISGNKSDRESPIDSDGNHKPAPRAALEVGVKAPNFVLPGTAQGDVALAELHGRPVILAFYPADWSPVCGDQMVLYNEILPEFERFDAQLLGVSVDSIWSHRAFAADRNLRFPLLSDFQPKGEVARAYGVYDAAKGTSKRALFVTDAEGIIRWSYVAPPGINPGANGILEALENL